jgi:hypothetical protein
MEILRRGAMATLSFIKHAVEPCTRFAAVLFICCIIFLYPPHARGGPVIGTEYKVKAGFIYNFVNFVTWPEEALKDTPGKLIFCFFTDNEQSDTLKELEGKTIKGRTIQVMALDEGGCIEQCQILFFATQNKDLIQKVLDQAKNRNILTIGEVEGFTRMGGIINFFEEQNRLRFKVNVDAARKAGLKMSSQLLSPAEIVHGGNE